MSTDAGEDHARAGEDDDRPDPPRPTPFVTEDEPDDDPERQEQVVEALVVGHRADDVGLLLRLGRPKRRQVSGRLNVTLS